MFPNRVWMFAPLTTHGFSPLDGSGSTWLGRYREVSPTDMVIGCNDRERLRRTSHLPVRESDLRFYVVAPGDAAQQANKRQELIGRAMAASAMGITPHLLVWLWPFGRFIRDTFNGLAEICRHAPIASIVLDCEEAWRGGGHRHAWLHDLSIDHYHQVVARDFVPALATLRDVRPGLRVGVSDIAMLGGNVRAALAPLIAACDYVMPQAYSSFRGYRNCLAAGNTPASCGVWRPQATQRAAWESWRSFGKPIVMLLNAYATRWADGVHSTTPDGGVAAMLQAVETLTMPEVREVGFWSLETLYEAVPRTGETAAHVLSRRTYLIDLCRRVRQAATRGRLIARPLLRGSLPRHPPSYLESLYAGLEYDPPRELERALEEEL